MDGPAVADAGVDVPHDIAETLPENQGQVAGNAEEPGPQLRVEQPESAKDGGQEEADLGERVAEAEAPRGMKIFVGNLPYSSQPEALRVHFERFGEVSDVILPLDPGTQRHRGFGFVAMPSREDAFRAIEGTHDKPFENRLLRVNEAQTKQKPKNVDKMKLFVGNLNFQTRDEELREYFSSFGNVLEVFLPLEHETGRPRGFGFVTFETRAEGMTAIQRAHDAEFQGRNLRVNEARPRTAAGPAAMISAEGYGGMDASVYGASYGMMPYPGSPAYLGGNGGYGAQAYAMHSGYPYATGYANPAANAAAAAMYAAAQYPVEQQHTGARAAMAPQAATMQQPPAPMGSPPARMQATMGMGSGQTYVSNPNAVMGMEMPMSAGPSVSMPFHAVGTSPPVMTASPAQQQMTSPDSRNALPVDLRGLQVANAQMHPPMPQPQELGASAAPALVPAQMQGYYAAASANAGVGVAPPDPARFGGAPAGQTPQNFR